MKLNRLQIGVFAAACLLAASSGVPTARGASPQAQEENKPATAPADVTGAWHVVLDTEGGDREVDMTLQVNGEEVTGKFGKADVKGTFKDNILDLAFSFYSDEVNQTATFKLKGPYKDGRITGNWSFSEYDGTFVANRTDAQK